MTKFQQSLEQREEAESSASAIAKPAFARSKPAGLKSTEVVEIETELDVELVSRVLD